MGVVPVLLRWVPLALGHLVPPDFLLSVLFLVEVLPPVPLPCPLLNLEVALTGPRAQGHAHYLLLGLAAGSYGLIGEPFYQRAEPRVSGQCGPILARVHCWVCEASWGEEVPRSGCPRLFSV